MRKLRVPCRDDRAVCDLALRIRRRPLPWRRWLAVCDRMGRGDAGPLHVFWRGCGDRPCCGNGSCCVRARRCRYRLGARLLDHRAASAMPASCCSRRFCCAPTPLTGFPRFCCCLPLFGRPISAAISPAARSAGRNSLPAVSPKKTWAGAVAGTVGAIARCRRGGARLARALDWRRSPSRACCCRCMAQLGDLLEFWIKRRFGAKDASQLIPGPWRRDGPARRFLGGRAGRRRCSGSLRGGFDNAARGLLVW